MKKQGVDVMMMEEMRRKEEREGGKEGRKKDIYSI
jgi:hypothetical protein